MFNDQVSYYSDMKHIWFWLPIVIGIGLFIAAGVVLVSSRSKADKDKEAASPKSMVPGLAMIGVGILCVVVPGVIISIRHPAAVVEQQIFRSII